MSGEREADVLIVGALLNRLRLMSGEDAPFAVVLTEKELREVEGRITIREADGGVVAQIAPWPPEREGAKTMEELQHSDGLAPWRHWHAITVREPRVPVNGCGCPDHQTMIRQLGEALGFDLPALPATPEQVWSGLLDEVERLRGVPIRVDSSKGKTDG